MIADHRVSSRLAPARKPPSRCIASEFDDRRTTVRRLIRVPLAALPLLCALTPTGCGSDEDGGSDVASAGGTSSTATEGKVLSQDERGEMALMFAQCMRENGVPMDDPEPGRGIQLKVGPGTSQETVRAVRPGLGEVRHAIRRHRYPIASSPLAGRDDCAGRCRW
jgi:hypothetical protein